MKPKLTNLITYMGFHEESTILEHSYVYDRGNKYVRITFTEVGFAIICIVDYNGNMNVCTLSTNDIYCFERTLYTMLKEHKIKRR